MSSVWEPALKTISGSAAKTRLHGNLLARNVTPWPRPLVKPGPKHLRFDRGFWWLCCPKSRQKFEITSLMRREAFKADRIARALGMGKWTLRRMVTDSLGIPLGYWLRMERAVSVEYRLREGCSVKELAVEYGFKHPGDFSEEFNRWHEIYPADFQTMVAGWRDA